MYVHVCRGAECKCVGVESIARMLFFVRSVILSQVMFDVSLQIFFL